MTPLCNTCGGETLWPCCVMHAHCACLPGLLQSAGRASGASVGRQVFPSLHSLGVQEWTGGQHRAGNTEDQPGQRCASVEGKSHSQRTNLGNVVLLLKVSHTCAVLRFCSRWVTLGQFCASVEGESQRTALDNVVLLLRVSHRELL